MKPRTLVLAGSAVILGSLLVPAYPTFQAIRIGRALNQGHGYGYHSIHDCYPERVRLVPLLQRHPDAVGRAVRWGYLNWRAVVDCMLYDMPAIDDGLLERVDANLLGDLPDKRLGEVRAHLQIRKRLDAIMLDSSPAMTLRSLVADLGKRGVEVYLDSLTQKSVDLDRPIPMEGRRDAKDVLWEMCVRLGLELDYDHEAVRLSPHDSVN